MFSKIYQIQKIDSADIAEVVLHEINLPKSRASKIVQFKHYTTDAPV